MPNILTKFNFFSHVFKILFLIYNHLKTYSFKQMSFFFKHTLEKCANVEKASMVYAKNKIHHKRSYIKRMLVDAGSRLFAILEF